MLNDMVQLFLDAYHQHIDLEYTDINYFDSCIVLGVELSMLIGALLIACITCWGTFKIINGVFGRA